MPVVGTPVAPSPSPSIISIDEVRAFLRDYPEKNPLLDDVEFSDEELTTSVARAVDFANMVDRPTNWTYSDFPNKLLLLMGAVSYLLMSESFRQLRNEAIYQDGNIQPVGLDNKQAAYAGLSQALRAEFRSSVSQIKISQNMETRGFYRSPLSYRAWR